MEARPPGTVLFSRLSPIGRKLGAIVVVFIAVVACLLFLVHSQIEIMAGVRAYVAGEGLWSKAQKDAVLSLQQFAASGDARDWQRYVDAIAVPLGDRAARLELEKRTPDLTVARRGFLQGRNHPDDVDRMIMLVRRLGSVSYMSDAIRIWSMADRHIAKLRHQGDALHVALSATRKDATAIARILAHIRGLNARVTPIEDAFSDTLGEGARQLGRLLFLGIVGSAVLLVTVGVLLSAMLVRRIRRGEEALGASRRQLEEEARVSGALARAAQELISTLEPPVVRHRLSQLTTELLHCEGSCTLVARDGDDAFTAVAAYGVASDALRIPRAMIAALFGGGEPTDVAAMHVAGGPPCLGMALRRGGEIIGVQVAEFRGGTSPAREHHRIAGGLAHIASMALANAALVGELERASRLKSEFVSTMSHELRTPLSVILGYVEMAREDGTPSTSGETMARIEASARDLFGLIESTLEIGKIENGRDEPQIESVAFGAFWTRLAESCGRLPRRQDVALEWRSEVPDLHVATDPRKLTVVIRNLVGNALKFTERGAVRVDARKGPEGLVLTVADTGVGIRREDQSTVFEMFRQGDGSDSRRFGGTGLGLYIVRRFVQQLAGTITLESAPGVGSVFTIALPVAGERREHRAA